MQFIIDHYLWIKAFHLIAVFSWMAGLFYLPRLFVYHSASIITFETSLTFKIMERKLLRFIMNPAMIMSWIFGLMLVGYHIHMNSFSQGWLHVKLLMVVFMTIFHQLLAYHRKQFEQDNNQKKEKYFRLINEIPTILLIVIVICVVVQPF